MSLRKGDQGMKKYLKTCKSKSNAEILRFDKIYNLIESKNFTNQKLDKLKENNAEMS